MSEWIQTVILSLVQGVTEFLPVSSSAHLILPSLLLGWRDQGLLFDVSVHAGTLGAVLVYFREKVWSLVQAMMLGSERDRAELVALIIATFPVVLVGMIFKDLIETETRDLAVIAFTTLLFGILLGLADRFSRTQSTSENIVCNRHALLIGIAQVFALIPGASRSGVTITAALFLGYHPATAARFSFLMSLPVIAGALSIMLLTAEGIDSPISIGHNILAFVLSALCAYATIKLFISLVSTVGLMPFVIYRIALGIILLGFVTKGF